MLESLGYAEVAGARGRRPDPVQHLLDPREGRRALRRPPAARRGRSSATRPGARHRRRRLLGAVGQGRGLPPLPLRRRRLRPRPGPQARRVPHLATRSPPRATSSSRASPATCRRSARATSRAGCRSPSAATAAAPTASCRPRAGARSRGRWSELVAEVRAMAADGVREVTLLGQNVNSYGRDLRPAAAPFAELLARARRDRGHRPHPLHEPAPEGHARGRRSAPTPSCRALCEHIHLPLQSGSSRDPEGHAPDLRPRPLPRPRRADPRARPRLRADHGHHRRLPGGDRGGLRARRSRSSRRSATTARSRSSSRPGAAPRRRSSRRTSSPHDGAVERMERLVEVVQRRARERAQRFVGRTLEVLVEGPSRTDPSRLRGRIAPQQGRELRGPGAPGELVSVEIDAATSQTLVGRGVAARPALVG